MKPTILAVDDDPILCDVYEAILGDLYNLHLASSGEEALEGSPIVCETRSHLVRYYDAGHEWV